MCTKGECMLVVSVWAQGQCVYLGSVCVLVVSVCVLRVSVHA